MERGRPKSRCLLERNPAECILAGFLDEENGFWVTLFVWEEAGGLLVFKASAYASLATASLMRRALSISLSSLVA